MDFDTQHGQLTYTRDTRKSTIDVTYRWCVRLSKQARKGQGNTASVRGVRKESLLGPRLSVPFELDERCQSNCEQFEVAQVGRALRGQPLEVANGITLDGLVSTPDGDGRRSITEIETTTSLVASILTLSACHTIKKFRLTLPTITITDALEIRYPESRGSDSSAFVAGVPLSIRGIAPTRPPSGTGGGGGSSMDVPFVLDIDKVIPELDIAQTFYELDPGQQAMELGTGQMDV